MIRRSRRVLPATVLGVLLFAICAAVAVSLVQRLVGAGEFLSYDTVAAELHGITWSELSVLLVGIAAVLAGVVLLGLAVWPGRPTVLPLAAEEQMDTGVTRGGLRAALRSTAGTVDGVRSARIRFRRNTVRVSARTDRTRSEGMAAALCDTLTRRIQEIGPQQARRVRARLRGPKTGGSA